MRSLIVNEFFYIFIFELIAQIMAESMSLVNLNYLKEMADGDSSIIKELIDIFFTQVDEFKQELNTCLEEKDWINLGKIAHKAKSSVAIMGMENLATKLKELEINAKHLENTEQYPLYVADFEKQCRQAVTELKKIYKTL